MGGPGSGRVRTPPYERFFEKVDYSEDGCWNWKGGTSGGAPAFWDGDMPVPGARWAWEHANGPIPPGGRIRRTCGNRKCVRPGHMKLHLRKVS